MLALLTTVGCQGDGERGARSKAPPKTAPSAAATPSPPPVTADELKRTLPPHSWFKGFRRQDYGELTIQDILDGALTAGSWAPAPPGACRSLERKLLVDSSRLATGVAAAPAATVTYTVEKGPRPRIFTAVVTTVPAATPLEATRLALPAGCRTYRVTVRGSRVTISLRQLPRGRLPSLPSAQVTGVDVTAGVPGAPASRTRTYNIRAQGRGLVMFLSIGGISYPTAKGRDQLLDAWSRATRQLPNR